MNYIEEQGRVPVKGSFDVIVAGGGVAGVSAALAARRQGKSVLIIEKSLMLGGLATLGLINFFVPMCNGRGRQIIFGMAEELLRASIRYGYDSIPEEWKNGEPGEGAKTRYVTKYSANIFAMVLMEMIVDEGVTLLLDSVVSKPVMKGGHCEGLIVENKSGREFYAGKMIVDATGDGDVMFRAGMPTVQGKNFFTYCAQGIDMAHIRKAAETGHACDAIFGVSGGGASLHGLNQQKGMRLFDGTTAEDVTEYIVLNQKKLMEKLKAQDRWERDVVLMPGMPQFRTTRHLEGDYVLKGDDRYRHFDDSIAALNDFEFRDWLYELPFRALVRTGYDNIIAAGRCASAEGWAWDVIRVIPPAILSGQAAGVACAQAIDAACAIHDLPVEPLQKQLEQDDMLVHFDDTLVPADETQAVNGAEKDHM